MNNKTNPIQGSHVKKLFFESIGTQHAVLNSILESLRYDIPNDTKFNVAVVTDNNRKTDVVIRFNDVLKLSPIRFNIKSFTDSDSNQIGRRGFPDFFRRNKISKPDYDFLEELWFRKARDSKTGLLVKEDDKPRVISIFKDIEPGVSELRGSDHPQIFVLYSINSKTFHLYNMDEQVIPEVRTNVIGFTKGNSNIQIGNYINIERHGAEDGINHETDINHASNDVQIKMRVKKFFENREIEPIASYIEPAE